MKQINGKDVYTFLQQHGIKISFSPQDNVYKARFGGPNYQVNFYDVESLEQFHPEFGIGPIPGHISFENKVIKIATRDRNLYDIARTLVHETQHADLKAFERYIPFIMFSPILLGALGMSQLNRALGIHIPDNYYLLTSFLLGSYSSSLAHKIRPSGWEEVTQKLTDRTMKRVPLEVQLKLAGNALHVKRYKKDLQINGEEIEIARANPNIYW